MTNIQTVKQTSGSEVKVSNDVKSAAGFLKSDGVKVTYAERNGLKIELKVPHASFTGTKLRDIQKFGYVYFLMADADKAIEVSVSVKSKNVFEYLVSFFDAKVEA